MKVYKCDICGQYVDDYQNINRGGKGWLRLTFSQTKNVTCDICDTCYDFLEAFTKWNQETRKDIYNYVIKLISKQKG